MPDQPDRERDVIVQHMHGHSLAGECWAVFLGPAKRAELPSADKAFVFARLLADLQQRRVWVTHGDDDELVPLESSALRGCSCC